MINTDVSACCVARHLGALTLDRMLEAVAVVSAQPVSNVLQLDLEPEEAQQYINNPPFAEPELAGRTNILPLIRYDDPRFRSAEAGPTLGHYWRNGEEIQDPENYQEEVYEAAQFHGQSGRGDYAYGYRTPESAKVEDRAGSGDVQGSYVYKNNNDQLVKVRYWADSQGFHQEDNLPKVELKPAEETPEVRAARLEHERAWQLARAASLLAPLPQEYQAAASELQGAVVAAPAQYPVVAARAQVPVVAAPAQNPVVAARAQDPQPRKGKAYQQQYYTTTTTTTTEEPEPTGPPRGFFYSFTYPVSVIVPKEGAASSQDPANLANLAARTS
ncbi:Cuticle protein 6 [Papilio machaon]|uniref:Cuticle protein 6 n=1 Tax=Papilio machaon TaxID=76193 RepID=A0A194RIU8_PAPMA|nr:Cuticle protein 6 [Papilio machaon]